MKYSLRVKMAFSYALVALLLVATISIISNVFLQKQFKNYIVGQQESKNTNIVALVTQQYNSNTNTWDTQKVESIGVSALEQGLIIKVKDTQGVLLWDATVHNNGMCQQMLTSMADDMLSRYPNFKGGYEEKSYSMQAVSQAIGSVDVGYYGPFYYNDNDVTFINALNRMLISVGVIALLFALTLGVFMAKRLSDPILKVINSAEKISKGNYKEKIQSSSTTMELDKLIVAINNLANDLENQENLRKRLTSNVAHELRTPLATLQSHMEALIDGVWTPSKERFISCHEEILRINRLVGDLGKLSILESENSSLSKTNTDVKELIEKIVRNFETEFKNKNIESNINGNSQNALIDIDKISQVFINLLSNALKYTPIGGSIKINIAEENDGVKIQITDNGAGISQEDLPHIFERFYRVDKSRSSLSGGAGIGLTIVKAIVEMHNGVISAESQVDKGTIFTIILPKE